MRDLYRNRVQPGIMRFCPLAQRVSAALEKPGCIAQPYDLQSSNTLRFPNGHHQGDGCSACLVSSWARAAFVQQASGAAAYAPNASRFLVQVRCKL
jgi:hypothetical protein